MGRLALRVVVGLVFVVHGGRKLFEFGLAGTAGFLGSLGIPLPTVAAMGVIAVEVLGVSRCCSARGRASRQASWPPTCWSPC
jgi:uncharacterized membrane protein YphA (DoxX/SURF4 family)